MKRRHVALAFAIPLAMVSAPGCIPDNPPVTVSPVTASPQASKVQAFTASSSSGKAPLSIALSWSVSGTGPLTCELDTDGNGSVDITITDCPSTGSRPTTLRSVGTHTPVIRVSGPGGIATRTTTITTSAAAPDPFNIDIVPLEGAGAYQSEIDAAVARWEAVIRNGLDDSVLKLPANYCRIDGRPAEDLSVDDLAIEIKIAPDDGPGGRLGSAGFCYADGGMPRYGAINLDVDDVARLRASGRLVDTLTHEIGHVLGIGTAWNFGGRTLLVGAGTGDPRFSGPVAVAAWATLGGSAAVPVESEGGEGTADAHWRESTFDDELMTGWLSGPVRPLSIVTVASLADLGYSVDLNGADPFSTAPSMRAFGLHGERHDEVAHVELFNPQNRP